MFIRIELDRPDDNIIGKTANGYIHLEHGSAENPHEVPPKQTQIQTQSVLQTQQTQQTQQTHTEIESQPQTYTKEQTKDQKKQSQQVSKNQKEAKTANPIPSADIIKHDGIRLRAYGGVSLKSGKLVHSNGKIPLLEYETQLAPPGTLHVGASGDRIRFEVPIKPIGSNDRLYESYNGKKIQIKYTLEIEVVRKLAKNVKNVIELPVHLPRDTRRVELMKSEQPVHFSISRELLQNIEQSSKQSIPDFRFEGQFDHSSFPLDNPLRGRIQLGQSLGKVNVSSVDLQLVHVETVGSSDAREASEALRLQVVSGFPAHGLPILLYMLIPPGLACPTVVTKLFRIEYELNVIITINEKYSVTENVPLQLFR